MLRATAAQIWPATRPSAQEEGNLGRWSGLTDGGRLAWKERTGIATPMTVVCARLLDGEMPVNVWPMTEQRDLITEDGDQ